MEVVSHKSGRLQNTPWACEHGFNTSVQSIRPLVIDSVVCNVNVNKCVVGVLLFNEAVFAHTHTPAVSAHTSSAHAKIIILMK